MSGAPWLESFPVKILHWNFVDMIKMNNFVDLVREHSGNEFVNMSQPGFHHQPPHPPKKRKTKQRLKETCLKVVIPKETTMFIPVKSCLLAQPLKWKSYSTQPFPLFLPTFLPHPFVEKLNTLRVFKTSPQVHHFEKKNSAISPYYPTGNEHISHLTGWNRENYELKNSTRDGIWVSSQGSHFSWVS